MVRRVDGRSLGRFLAEEVCGPLGLDFWVGLGEEQLSRVAELTGYDAAFRRRGEEGPALMGHALDNPSGALDPAVVNSHGWRTAEVPAVNGHGTARAVAGLYVALQQGRLLSAEMLHEATTPYGPRETDRVRRRRAAVGARLRRRAGRLWHGRNRRQPRLVEQRG